MGTDKIWSGFVNNFEIKLDKTSKVKLYHQLYLFFVNAIENKEKYIIVDFNKKVGI